MLVSRFRCQRCGSAWRAYPEGLDSGRQSVALRRLSALLYGIGLSYQIVRAVLADFGCSLSTATIRKNVVSAGLPPRRSPFERLCLSRGGPGELSGPDGWLRLRLRGQAEGGRWLELQVAATFGEEDIVRRLGTHARRLGLPVYRVSSHREVHGSRLGAAASASIRD